MSATTPPVPFVTKAQLVTGGLVAGLLIGGGGAGYAWWTGQSEVARMETQAAADLEAAEEVAETINAQLAKMEPGSRTGAIRHVGISPAPETSSPSTT